MPARKPAAPKPETYTDFIQPFLIDHSAIRGRLVRLDKLLNKILRAHDYPAAVSKHLAEQMVLASLLSATLSGEGMLTVQVKGNGPVRFIVVDVMAGGTMRGYADLDREALEKIEGEPTLQQLVGKGYLAVTLDPGDAERYQSIVDLSGETLSEAFRGYFAQSNQVEIDLHVCVSAPDKQRKKWMAGGIIIERIPQEGGHETKATAPEQEELWSRTKMFMRTLKDDEILDPTLTPQNMLYRLFNEDGVWVYKLQPLKAGCRCSRDRVKTVLKTLDKEELKEMLEDKKLTIHCQFCTKREVFTEADINKLYSKPVSSEKTQ